MSSYRLLGSYRIENREYGIREHSAIQDDLVSTGGGGFIDQILFCFDFLMLYQKQAGGVGLFHSPGGRDMQILVSPINRDHSCSPG